MNFIEKIWLAILITLSISFFTLEINSSIKEPTIVGGKEVKPHSYPFMVSVQYKDTSKHFCGGALISPKTVVTAAHCTEGKSANNLKVLVGGHNLKNKKGHEQEINVSEIIMHDDFNSLTFENDIAVLHLKKPVNLDVDAQLITLPRPYQRIRGKTTIIGWGRLSENGSSPNVLNEVNVSLVKSKKCKAIYKGEIFPGMICASAKGKDSCQGDSGGPLFKDTKLIGLVSWGNGCAKPNYPGVYTKVSNYINFINENMLW